MQICVCRYMFGICECAQIYMQVHVCLCECVKICVQVQFGVCECVQICAQVHVWCIWVCADSM